MIVVSVYHIFVDILRKDTPSHCDTEHKKYEGMEGLLELMLLQNR